ncbi:MAG TPA: tetratricopeptide repeat protein [Opitutaceae bacterium]|nr:tetratricopeptide repeat protein [Opitutaceae bacterium]
MIGSLIASLERRPWVAGVLLVLAVAAAYANALHGAFVWDDVPTIVQNRAIEHFGTAVARPTAVNTSSGRPLLGLSLALNYALGGRDPIGYHFFNLVVHAAAALTLFGFVRRLALLPRWGGRYAPHATGLALAVAALWALQPLQTQAVTFVVQRAEAMMGLCYLLTLWLFLRSAASPRPGWWRGLAVAACAVGMTAKEVMVSAPVMVLLFDRTFLAGSFRGALGPKKRFYAALFGTWLILAWLVISLGGNRDGSTGGFSAHANAVQYWLTQFPAIATYLKLAFLPAPLIFQYGAFWLPSAAAALPAALLVVPLAVLALVALVRWPAAGFCGFWFFSVLAVTSLIPGTVDMVVDYRMYLALAPLWIVVVAAVYRWVRMPLAVSAVVLAFGVLTVARNRVYRSELALWTDNVAKRPGNALARYNLATDLLREPGHEAEAQAQLEAAVKLAPDFAGARYNLGSLLSQQPGRAAEAIAQYEAAIRIAPRYAQAHNNLAVILDRRGEFERARRHFQLAVQYDPSNEVAWLNLVRVLEELHRADDALAACRALVQAHPNSATGQARLGIMLATRQALAESIPHLEAAVRLDPGQLEAAYYLGTVLVQRHERMSEAVALLEKVVKARPDSAYGHFNLGIAYLASGNRLRDAIAQFEATVRLDPRNANAQFNLAGALEAAGNPTGAITHYRVAAALQPRMAVNHFRLARLLALEPSGRAEAREEIMKTLAIDPGFPGVQALLAQLDQGD